MSVQVDNAALMKRLKIKYGILGIAKHGLLYAQATINSVLKQFEYLMDREFSGSSILDRRFIKFGQFNGLDHLGRLVINVYDVPEDWKKVIF